MKPADDPGTDYCQLVRRGYDACAASYDAARRADAEPALSWITCRLEPGARVLDLGCGAGVPVTRQLAQAYRVLGVDLSPEMIARARAHVPMASFVCADAMDLDLEAESLDAVVSFYAVFHIPRERHRELFERIYGWLAPGGSFLATLAQRDEPAYTEEDFFGVTMYWSNYGLSRYLAMLRSTGFEIAHTGELGHGYGAEHETPAEHHPVVLAVKPACDPSRCSQGIAY